MYGISTNNNLGNNRVICGVAAVLMLTDLLLQKTFGEHFGEQLPLYA